ncbi:MAG: hypothetical protein ABF665_16160 [Gluconacetobacter sp.]
MSGKVTRKTAPQMPTGMTHSRTNEVTIVDFLYEESLGSKDSYVSFSTIVLTKDLAKNLMAGLAAFLKEKEGDDGK